jgi:signal peptidase I
LVLPPRPAAVENPATDPAPAAPVAEKSAKRKGAGALREIAIIVVVALVVSAVVRAFFFQAFYIPSGSMENTLQIDDRVVVSKIGERFGDPKRGDIVVFKDPGGWLPPQPDNDPAATKAVRRGLEIVGLAPARADEDLVKRVIGVGGDRVVCCDPQGRVTVNGIPLEEASYIFPGDQPSDIPFDVAVPAGRYFVMGDHRSASGDSRVHLTDPGSGTISGDDIIGRAVLKVWPFSRFGTLPVPETFTNPQLVASRP